MSNSWAIFDFFLAGINYGLAVINLIFGITDKSPWNLVLVPISLVVGTLILLLGIRIWKMNS